MWTPLLFGDFTTEMGPAPPQGKRDCDWQGKQKYNMTNLQKGWSLTEGYNCGEKPFYNVKYRHRVTDPL